MKEPRLVPIQDVQTRWNSTFLMLRRAKRLESSFNCFCLEYAHTHLQITSDEWRQVDYLLCIMRPFFQFTTALSKTKDVTIHTVFNIYNRLFDHLERSIRQLKGKKIGWKQQMLQALESAESKLREYYYMTDTRGLSDIFAISTVLDPQYKLDFFKTPDWQDPETDYSSQYQKSMEERVKQYQDRLHGSSSLNQSQNKSPQTNELYSLLGRGSTSQGPQSELTQYLQTGKSSFFPFF